MDVENYIKNYGRRKENARIIEGIMIKVKRIEDSKASEYWNDELNKVLTPQEINFLEKLKEAKDNGTI